MHDFRDGLSVEYEPDFPGLITLPNPIPRWLCDAQTGEVVAKNAAFDALFADLVSDGHPLTINDVLIETEKTEIAIQQIKIDGFAHDVPVLANCGPEDGTWLKVSAVRGEQNGRAVVACSVLDIDDSTGSNQGLRKARDVLRDAIESLSEGFALYDDDSRLVMCNQRYRKMNKGVADLLKPGLSWEILMRESARRGIYKDAIGREEEWVSDRLENGVQYIQDFELNQTDGSSYLVSVHPTNLGGFVVTRTDITSKKQAEAVEREGDILVRHVLDSSPAAVVMARLDDGQIIYRSPAASDLFGKILSIRDFFKAVNDRADYVTAILADGYVDDFKVTLINGDGKAFPALIYGRIAEYRGDDVVVTTVIDLTDELAMQEELENQRNLLFQNEKMSALGELLAGVAHELNNPLSVVVGHALMMQEEVQDPDLVRRVEKIGSAAERCAKIVKTFLAMARQQPTRMERVDIGSVIATAADVASFGYQSDGLSIEQIVPDGLPDLFADPDQITQVIINLVINAEQAIAKSRSGDRIVISASVSDDARNLEIRVADNGPGVPDYLRARIFEPFFTTKDVGDGTGIGLAFCYRTVRSHGGHIWLDPAVQEGAHFCITLPIAKPTDGTSGDDQTLEPVKMALRALVVDDEPDVAELIAEILKRNGFVVDFASTGAVALSRLSNQKYDLVLSDLNMPDVDGRGLYEVILRDHPDLAKRTGFITGDTMGISSQAFLKEANRPFMEKPVSPVELRNLVHKILAEPKRAQR
ncbi:MAG: ATP-binding protein [Pseudomonadota bacterium]